MQLALSKAQAEVNRETAVEEGIRAPGFPGHFAGRFAVQQAQSDVGPF